MSLVLADVAHYEGAETVLSQHHLLRLIIENSGDKDAMYSLLCLVNKCTAKLALDPLYSGFRNRLLKDKIKKLTQQMKKSTWNLNVLLYS